jgi:energy-coupling factor transport system permease protein
MAREECVVISSTSRWRTVDIVVAAVIAAAFGVVFWAWDLLWNAVSPAFVGFPPGQGVMYGIWLLPGVLGGLVIRKPGAAVFTEFVAATVSALMGTSWGFTTVVYGLLEGLGPELVFAVLAYRRWGRGAAVAAAAVAGVVAAVLDVVLYYPDWKVVWIGVYVALLAASSAVIAGLGSVALTRRLAQAGVLDQFAAGRDGRGRGRDGRAEQRL